MKSSYSTDAIGSHPAGVPRAGRQSQSILHRRWWSSVGSLALLALLAVLAAAQDVADDEEEEAPEPPKVAVPLMDREPFFQLTLTAANDNAVLEILPLDQVPVDPKPADRLRLRLVRYPDQEYEVAWEHIAKLRTFHQLVFEEAQRLVQEKKYNAAFRNFDYLLKNTTATPGLKNAVLAYLLENATVLLAEKKTDHALAILEELSERDRDFRTAEVNEKLSLAADTLISQEVDRGDLAAARLVIERLDSRYGSGRIATLAAWRQRFIDQAMDLKRQAEQKMAAGGLREAEQLSRRLEAIWPELPGGRVCGGRLCVGTPW